MLKKAVSIVEAFPGFEEKINFLFQSDEDFRELCSDHFLCVAMLQELIQRLNKNADDVKEFKELQRNLEEEILQRILNKKSHL